MNEWIKFPCGQGTCRECFHKLVQTCPSEILKRPDLALFEPDRNPAHHYSCPFCKMPYTPRTKVQHHKCSNDVTAHEVEVCELVPTPYAYQSFDHSLPAHIPTAAEYPEMQDRFAMYWDKVRAERLRETQANARNGGIPMEELFGIHHLPSVTDQCRYCSCKPTLAPLARCFLE